MEPSESPKCRSESDEHVTSKFDAGAEAHLKELIGRAGKNLASNEPIALRTAAMYVLDYYQAILTEAAGKVGVDLEGASILVRISRVRSSIGGLQIDGLEGLQEVRTAVYHYENRVPSKKALRKYIDEARTTRKVLLEGAATAVAKEKVMTRAAQRLRASGEELLRLLPSITSENARHLWKTRADRAVQVAKGPMETVGGEELDLLLQITGQIAVIRTAAEIMAPEPPPEYYEPYDEGPPEPPPEDYEPYDEEPPEYVPEPDDYPEDEYPEPEFDPGDFYPDEPPPDEEPPNDQPPDDELSDD